MRTRKCDDCGRERPYFALDEITDAGTAGGPPRTVCSDQAECIPPDETDCGPPDEAESVAS